LTLINALLKGQVLNPNHNDLWLLQIVRNELPPSTPVELAWIRFQANNTSAKSLRISNAAADVWCVGHAVNTSL